MPSGNLHNNQNVNDEIQSFKETLDLIRKQLDSSYQPLTRLNNIKQILEQHDFIHKELYQLTKQEKINTSFCDNEHLKMKVWLKLDNCLVCGMPLTLQEKCKDE